MLGGEGETSLVESGLTALGGAVTAFLGWLGLRRRNRADAVKAEADAAVALGQGWENFASKLQQEVDRLRNDMATRDKQCEERIDALTTRVDDLTALNVSLQQEVEGLTTINGKLRGVVYRLAKGHKLDAAQKVLVEEIAPEAA